MSTNDHEFIDSYGFEYRSQQNCQDDVNDSKSRTNNAKVPLT